MKVILAKKYGFCFGVKRAIKIAEKNRFATTFGELIHNPKEIARLKNDFGVGMSNNLAEIDTNNAVIVRTHGITKGDLEILKSKNATIIDATCPFVTKPQNIVKEMSAKEYQIFIFGDKTHPEVKGVASYGDNVHIIASVEELDSIKLHKKIALLSQTTKQIEHFCAIASYLLSRTHECRVFNTICNATFDNQSAVEELSKEVDVMVIVGGKNSSNTKQLLDIAKKHCADSYLVEDECELNAKWFENKRVCGISAGASTPGWIIKKVENKIREI